MATPTKLLRAAEHMRERANNTKYRVDATRFNAAADELEREAVRLRRGEAKRLQAIEPKRTWPEGWPPFAILRWACEQIQVEPTPSTLWCERNGQQSSRWVASEVRKAFALNVSALAAQRTA